MYVYRTMWGWWKCGGMNIRTTFTPVALKRSLWPMEISVSWRNSGKVSNHPSHIPSLWSYPSPPFAFSCCHTTEMSFSPSSNFLIFLLKTTKWAASKIDCLAVREEHRCKSFKWFMEEIAYDIPLHYPLPPKNVEWGEVSTYTHTRRMSHWL